MALAGPDEHTLGGVYTQPASVSVLPSVVPSRLRGLVPFMVPFIVPYVGRAMAVAMVTVTRPYRDATRRHGLAASPMSR